MGAELHHEIPNKMGVKRRNGLNGTGEETARGFKMWGRAQTALLSSALT